jgi:ATP-dependent helicase/nuclease subunit B
VVAALRAAVGVVLDAWSTEAVLRYLAGELPGLPPHHADALAAFARDRELAGPAWYQGDFPEAPARRRARLRRWAQRLAQPLRRFEEAVGRAPTGVAAVEACYALLEDLRAGARVAHWAEEAEAEGDLDLAAWHRACWDAAIALLDEAALVLGAEPVPPREALAVLATGLDDLTVGLVPPALDQVLCGAVDRSRQPELRAAFVLGLGAGLFPQAPSEPPLLGEAERVALAGQGVDLGARRRDRLLLERYLGYIALTRARERLYLAYPAPAGPSELVRAVQRLLPHAGAWGPPSGPTARGGLLRLAADVVGHLAASPGDPAWQAARAWLEADPRRAAEAAPVLRALAPRRTTAVPAELAARLWGPPWTPTRLEVFATCPFQHFARYGLRLREPPPAGLDARDLGAAVHAALAAFVEALLREGRDPAELAPEELTARVEPAVARAARALPATSPAVGARREHLLRLLGREVLRAAEHLVAHARAGRYRPLAVELPVEEPVAGRVDRLDGARDDAGRLHLRVVDYKTGDATFRLDRFVDQVDLAPALYLAGALAMHSQALPGGFFLAAVRDEIRPVSRPEAEPPGPRPLSGIAPQEPEARALHDASGDGRVLPSGPQATADAEGFALLLRAAARRVEALGARLRAGEIGPRPYRSGSRLACADCPFPAVCRFDPEAGDAPRPALRGDPWAALRAEEGADR